MYILDILIQVVSGLKLNRNQALWAWTLEFEMSVHRIREDRQTDTHSLTQMETRTDGAAKIVV